MTQCFSIFLFFHNSRELLIAVNHPDDITHLQHSDNRKRFTFLEKLTYNSNDNYCRSFKVQGDHVHARFQLSRKHIFFFFSFSSRQFHLPPPQNRHDMRRISIFNRQSETSFSKRFPHSVKVSNVSQERLSTDVIMLGYRLHESLCAIMHTRLLEESFRRVDIRRKVEKEFVALSLKKVYIDDSFRVGTSFKKF